MSILFTILYIGSCFIGIFFLVKFLIREHKFNKEVCTMNMLNLKRIADFLDRKDVK